ncbi:hypothetical protein [Streptomyces sp. MP131-18]|uniref:hypothetical protein n=1 Tax=Streptomyces sp. MP131-18 TaxID=1857892 RepID=UPI0009CEB6C4|nr:hypothetical protein [Streptomyces sp. MP131-18]ONK14163.1 hypothetical protein STBA_49420 [Streptomyces sp. MP131-18]
MGYEPDPDYPDGRGRLRRLGRRALRCHRGAGRHFVNGLYYSAGTGVVSLITLWLQHRS